MALKAVLEKQEDIPAGCEDHYVERDGKWTIVVEGMATQGDMERMRVGLEKERKDHKATKDKLGAFGELKPDEVRTKLDRIEELEALANGKVDDEKINTIVEGRIKVKVAPLERKIKELETANLGLSTEVEGHKTSARTRTIHDEVRKAGTKLKLLPEALEDALMLGERAFEVGEDGVVTTKDIGGITAGLSPEVWLSDMKTKRPHWWGPSTGGGAAGGGGGGSLADNPFTHEKWNMTAQAKLLNTDPAKAEQLAKAAGTTIGGRKPDPKK